MKKKTANVLKWIGVAIITLGVLHTVLLVASNRALRRAYAALESDGRPLSPEQVIPAEIPDTDNAALVFEAVVLLLKAEPAGEENLFTRLSAAAEDVLEEKPGTDAKAQFRGLVQKSGTSKALAILQEGFAKPGCRYDLDYTAGAGLVVPHIIDLRSLSHILCAQARLQSEDGDHTAAWNTALDSLRLANALKDEPLVICQLLRIAQFSLVSDTIQHLASVSPPPNRQITELNLMLTGFEIMAPLAAAMDGERVLFGEWVFNLPASEVAQAIDGDMQPQGVSSPFQYAIAKGLFSSPLFKRDHAVYLTILHGYAQHATEIFSPHDAALEEEQMKNLPRYCILTRLMVPALSEAKTRYLSMIAQARVTRVGLAFIKERQEKGAYPEGLKDLDIGNSLDPFTGKPLVCQVTPSGFAVYSIGENLTDDQGKESKEGRSGDIVWRYSEKRTAEN